MLQLFFIYSTIHFIWPDFENLDPDDQLYIIDAPDCFGYLLRGIQKLSWQDFGLFWPLRSSLIKEKSKNISPFDMEINILEKK